MKTSIWVQAQAEDGFGRAERSCMVAIFIRTSALTMAPWIRRQGLRAIKERMLWNRKRINHKKVAISSGNIYDFDGVTGSKIGFLNMVLILNPEIYLWHLSDWPQKVCRNRGQQAKCRRLLLSTRAGWQRTDRFKKRPFHGRHRTPCQPEAQHRPKGREWNPGWTSLPRNNRTWW